MNLAIIAPVRYSVTVPIPAERAFALFTDGFNTWWIGHHIGEAEMAEAVIEPRVDGSWYERGVDGTECDWGKVLAFEPPDRVLLTWQLNCQFKYDPDLSRTTPTCRTQARWKCSLSRRTARPGSTWSIAISSGSAPAVTSLPRRFPERAAGRTFSTCTPRLRPRPSGGPAQRHWRAGYSFPIWW